MGLSRTLRRKLNETQRGRYDVKWEPYPMTMRPRDVPGLGIMEWIDDEDVPKYQRELLKMMKAREEAALYATKVREPIIRDPKLLGRGGTPIYQNNAPTPLREIVAPGWEIVEWREHRVDNDETWCLIQARHKRCGLDIMARYRFHEEVRETQFRRAECIEKLWKQMVAEQAVEDGIV